MAGKILKTPSGKSGLFFMTAKIPIGFDEEAWAWIVADAKAKLAFAKGVRPKRDRALVARIVASRKKNAARLKRKRRKEREMLNRESFEILKRQRETTGSARLHVLAAMEPDQWYGAADIAGAIGAPIRTVKGLLTFRMTRDGLVARADNPAYVRPLPHRPQEEREPMYLWSLTEDGCNARADALARLEALGRPDYRGIKNAPPASR